MSRLACLALAAALGIAACGHYGPPRRARPVEESPAPDVAGAAEECEDESREEEP